MFGLPLHPALVHLPLGVAAIVPLVLAFLMVQLWRGKIDRKGFAFGVALQAFVAAGAGLALVTGQAEEDRALRVIPEAAIEHHETLAVVFLVGALVTLALVVATRLAPLRATRALAVGSMIFSLAVVGVGVAVGHAGGQLVYKHNAPAAYGAASASAPAAHAAHDD